MGGRLKLVVLTIILPGLMGAAPPPEFSAKGMVAADHHVGSEAGAQILAQGGNAIDAAVATALSVGVVQPAGSGLGGGGFAVVVPPGGTAEVIDFREVAPAASTQDMYAKSDDERASRIGGLAVAVPGESAGLLMLHKRWGKLPFSAVAKPAVDLARNGFEVGPHLAAALDGLGADAVSMSTQLFGTRDVPNQGDWVQRTVLAKTIEQWAAGTGDGFRKGPIAKDIAKAVQAAGGIMTLQDLERYAPRQRAPVVGSYRGWKVITMPPPSSGGAVLMQVLGAMEGSEPAGHGPHSAAHYHRLAEAMKHAFADRARWMGDPDRIDVPMEAMLSPERIAAIRQDFDPSSTHAPEHYGLPVNIGTDGGTQHISVLDADGFAVALTTTINTSFGSRVVAPKTGLLLNNEMDDFVARPGVPNHYGLVGSEANAVAPGARPLSSMSPTVLVSPDGTERLVVGASGGPFIISSTLQAIINVIDFGMDPAEAVSVPRMHHQWAPNLLFVDAHTSLDTIAALEARGHTVKAMDFFSAVQMIHGTSKGTYGASDPRKGGWPAGQR